MNDFLEPLCASVISRTAIVLRYAGCRNLSVYVQCCPDKVGLQDQFYRNNTGKLLSHDT